MARQRAGTGTVYKNAERGTYIGEVTLDGRRVRVTARTKKDAGILLARRIADHKRGVLASDGNATLGQALDAWQTRILPGRDLSPKTVENYVWALAVLRAELGTTRLRRLDVNAVEAAFDRLAAGSQGRPLGRRSLALIRSTLGQVLDHAQRRGFTNNNPARLAELTPTATRRKTRQALNESDARRLWDALDGERLAALFRLQLLTGLRPGEAAGVCWDAVNLDAGTLVVRRAVRTVRNRPILTDELKTSSSYRTIGLPAAAVDVLREQRRTVTAERLAAADWTDLDLVFPAENGRPLDTANRRRVLRRACKTAGLPELSPNELRHTAATVLSDRGVPLEQIADLLGHTSTRMLDEVYRHRIRASADAAVGILEDLAGNHSQRG